MHVLITFLALCGRFCNAKGKGEFEKNVCMHMHTSKAQAESGWGSGGSNPWGVSTCDTMLTRAHTHPKVLKCAQNLLKMGLEPSMGHRH